MESNSKFVFEDYSALFVIDHNASLTSMSLPVLTWNHGIPSFGFHYHPYSDGLSEADSLAQSAFGFPIHVIFDGYFLTNH